MAANPPADPENLPANRVKEIMSPYPIKLYHAAGSPNSRRVRIFLAEKAIDVTLVPIDLSQGEQHSESYRTINPRRVVPTLVLPDGTAIGEVPAIWRYIEEAFPDRPLLGTEAVSKALIAMWERRVELEGFAAVMEGVRNAAARLQDRAIAGPHNYEQIPGLIARSRRRVANFYADFEARLAHGPFVAGDAFSAADITMIVTVDFATRAFDMPIPAGRGALLRWYEDVAARPSMAA
jgi:glutathione S-transferase